MRANVWRMSTSSLSSALSALLRHFLLHHLVTLDDAMHMGQLSLGMEAV